VDATGYSVPGAMLSIMGNHLLNDIVNQKEISEPAKILTQLHYSVRSTLHQSHEGELDSRDGMEICLVAIQPIAKELQFAGAYLPLYILRRNIVEEIKADRLAIGGIQPEKYRIFTNKRQPLATGDTIFLLTDGLTNQIGGDWGKRFTTKRLKECLSKLGNMEETEQITKLKKEFYAWKNDHEQTDDLLVIGIKIQ
ncbi:MAG: serine/threonine-protein phosphatase, partial [Bacteroidia bacterium]|nr:serine/threonine-protein phosphatase [Bacteroidia bacterium]